MGSKVEKHDTTKLDRQFPAPGGPGKAASWSSGAKTAVGTAISLESRVWFTIADGILTELYFPDIDCANLRDLRFVVAGGGFVSDEQKDADHKVEPLSPGVPGFRISSTGRRKDYRLDKEVITDPTRDVLLLNVAFEPPAQSSDTRLYVIANPHLRDRGAGNNAWVGKYKGVPMLFAERDGLAIALSSSAMFLGMSCGFTGRNDGLTDLRSHKRMTYFYTQASKGNVALTAEIDWRACQGRFRVALGCGGHAAEAGQQARAGLLQEFSSVRDKYVNGWRAELAKYIEDGDRGGSKVDHFRTSISVLRTHESKRFPGGFIASLSIPWGFGRGDDSTGGYHVLWPRDMGETVLALAACGHFEGARRALFYLCCTQEADGNWSQNMWLDGTPHWTSTQMDGTCFGILIGDTLRRAGELGGFKPWPMIKRAASFLVRNGPVTEEDRWEANAGYSPYTIAVQVAALLAAADCAEVESEREVATFLRETADAWKEVVDELTYVSETKLAKKYGVDGYYFRIMPPEGMWARNLDRVKTKIKDHEKGKRQHPAINIVSCDALALVRFGLCAADDPKILDTLKVIDSELKVETCTGPVWHRYTYDGYGEHDDGSPFDGTGKGRGWPLLAGERAYYEIARGNFAEAQRLQGTIEAQTSQCGLIPEQVWDAEDIPARKLFNGRPTGSSMPLVWAHAEYLKLLRSLRDREVWNTPPQTVQRYLKDKQKSEFQIWTRKQPRTRLSQGKDLRIDSDDAITVEWTVNSSKTRRQTETTEHRIRRSIRPIARGRMQSRGSHHLRVGEARGQAEQGIPGSSV